jgi:tetratricopeptide (TPR) repeat protein
MKRFVPCVILAVMAAVSGCATIGNFQAPSLHFQSPVIAASDKENPSPDQATLYLNVVGGLVTQRNYGAALAFLDDYAVRERDRPSRYWLLRGDALLGLGRGSEAQLAYDHLDATPLAPQGWNGKGRAAAAIQRWPDAATDFRVAATMLPSNAEILNNLAFAEMHLGDGQSSVAILRQARELDPGSNLIRNNLIVALTLAGDRGGAEKMLGDIRNISERNNVRDFAQKAAASRDLIQDGRSQ